MNVFNEIKNIIAEDGFDLPVVGEPLEIAATKILNYIVHLREKANTKIIDQPKSKHLIWRKELIK